MLAESENMSIFTKTAHIFWENEEWDLVAAELKRQNPRRNTDSFNRLEFTSMEVEDAAEIVLEQDRQRSYDNFNMVRRPLFDAFQRMKKNGPVMSKVVEGGISKAGHIVWSEQEYKAIIDELYRMNPLHVQDGSKSVNMKEMHEAMQILEPHRRRSFRQLVTFRETITRMWARRPVSEKPIIKEVPKLVTKTFTTGVIAEPVAKKSDGYHAVATALHAAFQAPDKPKPEAKIRKPYVSWSPEDWVLIAREMRRQNPHINFFASKFAIIDLPAIREAQRVVFPLEHRKSLAGTLGLQAPLVEAFKTLRVELDKEREEEDRAKLAEEAPAVFEVPTVEPVAEVAAVPVIEPAKVVPPKPIVQARQVGENNVVISSEFHSEAESGFIASVTNAAIPLMSLLISEITKNITAALIPEMTKAIQTAMEGVKTAHEPPRAAPEPVIPVRHEIVATAPQIAPAPIPQEPQARPTAAEIAAYNNVTVKPKKPKIVMLGPMGKQITDIEQAYPNYNFVFIQNGHGVKESAVGCELFLAYTSHMNAARKGEVKKYVPFEKLRRIEGSLSSVKHQIDVWEKSK